MSHSKSVSQPRRRRVRRNSVPISNLTTEIGQKPLRTNKEDLLDILSKGEQRAFYILQFLFDVESRKQSKQPTLLILDDIADSFDYRISTPLSNT